MSAFRRIALICLNFLFFSFFFPHFDCNTLVLNKIFFLISYFCVFFFYFCIHFAFCAPTCFTVYFCIFVFFIFFLLIFTCTFFTIFGSSFTCNSYHKFLIYMYCMYMLVYTRVCYIHATHRNMPINILPPALKVGCFISCTLIFNL